jgi:hypothetical protein
MLKRFVTFFGYFAVNGCATVFTGSTNNVQVRVVDDTSN